MPTSPAPDVSRRRTAQGGFALIEIMVTVLVITFGLISLAGLQLATKSGGNTSYQRTLALTVANEMIERVSLNPSQAAAYHTGLGTGLGRGSLGAVGTDCTVAANSCTPAQLAAWDLWNWERRLDGAGILDVNNNDTSGLLEARGCVVFTSDGAASPNSGQLRVIVSWRALTDTTDAATTAATTCGAVGTGTDAGRQQVVLNSYVINPGDYAP
ncbi:type IV pilus modification protein PilV [uncultured Hydrogenophaga sp.]|uniref:type IV pilus modification protein PilV n=1 Tax=uncultured Hydrogenophaga sp. TaxID=199683 RepID=UPI00265F16C9|nr:type IV pilus modification protein PilV [uncultured Hydrogenophaga sp.]